MTATLREWGHSIGLCLPKKIVREAALTAGSTYSVAIEATGVLRLVPMKPRPGIEELCARITRENRHPETDCRRTAGKEVW